MPEEGNKMEQKPNSRVRLMNRYRASRPDINWDEAGDEYDVDGLAADELEAFDADRKANKEANDKMNELFGKDETAARLFLDWSNGQDPVEKYIEHFGDDFIEALQSEEGKAKYKEALNKWRTGKQAEAEHQKLYDKNIDESARTLIEFADENNLNDEQLKGIVEKAFEIGSNIVDGLYSKDVLEMILKANNYDTAVSDAREEGRVEGKSENIRRELRESKPATGLPPTVGGQNAVTTETMQKPKKGKIAMFGGIEATRK